MRYNIYKVYLGLETFEVCGETEQDARILCSHSNRRSIKDVSSSVKIGESDYPYIKKISEQKPKRI